MRELLEEIAHTPDVNGSPEMKVNPMPPINVQELSPRGHQVRAHRLRRLKRSLETDRYAVNSMLVAGGMIREAFLDAASRKPVR